MKYCNNCMLDGYYANKKVPLKSSFEVYINVYINIKFFLLYYKYSTSRNLVYFV